MDLIKMPYERCVHIVDDEATVRDSLAVLLSTAGIKSRAYASAEEYLASVPLSEPACVILDNQLPGLSGMELLKRIADAEDAGGAAHAARAGGPDLADRGTADQAHCPPLRDQREDDRASQGRGHAKDGGAHYFPPCADGAQSWAFNGADNRAK
jgi:CheY-like chemotaxis protein